MLRISCSLVLLLGCPLFAQQHGNEYSKCSESATTQMQMNACASGELKRADAEMNRIYQALLQKRKDDPDATAKTRAAQRAWLKFRDAHMAEVFPAANPQVEYGSIYPMLYALEEASVTRERVTMLQDILEPKDNP